MAYSDTAKEPRGYLCSALSVLDSLMDLILGTSDNFIFL